MTTPAPSPYDESADPMFEPAVVGPTVDLLEELAEGGLALEFGVGTGRIAIPLARRVPVHGIDSSESALARLRDTPGAELVGTTLGDMASTRGPGHAGMELIARWDGWSRGAFTADSTSHVSVWQRR